MKRKSLALPTLLAALALALVACGGEEPASDAGSAAPTRAPEAATAGSVTAAESPLGITLTDAEGRTLYAFTKDADGKSSCYDACAASWPALTVQGDPSAGAGVEASLLATAEREDGAAQVTYKGMPLYYYAGDQQPGEAKGQGVGGVWFTVAPDGGLVRGAAPAGSGSGSGDGYP
jgi:predicted lipoprotein with Yx(FWY)xxD motif